MEHMNNPNSDTPPTQARNGNNGHFERNPATAERDAEAARLRTRGHSYRQIATQLGIDVHTAHDAVKRVLKETVQEAGDDLRAVSLQRLDDELETLDGLEALVRDTLKRRHVTVSQGRVVYDEQTGEAIADDAFILQAVAQLQKIAEQRRKCEESRRKLLGMDQPPKLEVSGGITYEIVGISPDDLT